MRILIPALFLTLALSGCTTADDAPDTVTVRAPDDYDYLANQTAQVHVHDYWASQTELTLMDVRVDLGDGPDYSDSGTYEHLLPFLPDGVVVPQGTSALRIEVDYEGSSTSQHGDGTVFAEAPDGSSIEVGVTGEPHEIPVNASQADAPHNQISDWSFSVLFEDDAGVFYVNEFVNIEIVAFRGEGELPTFPEHPDNWGNTTEKLLFRVDDFATHVHFRPATEGCAGVDGGCLSDISPDDGVIVPPDANHVEVTVESSSGAPTGFSLEYHAADGRAWLEPESSSESGGRITYSIPVGTRGDSPYAETSLWSFRFRPAQTAALGDYELSATVYQHPAVGPAPL